MSKVLYSFLIILASVLLALLPFSGAITSLLTDLRKDTFYVSTSGGTTNTTVQLHEALYDSDTTSISFASGSTSDAPLAASYNSTTRALVVTGLGANLTRNLDVDYSVDAVNNTAFSTALTTITYLWLIIIPLFAISGLAFLWSGTVRGWLTR